MQYSVKDKTEINVAAEYEQARFFNESTAQAKTHEYCEYEEEVEDTQSIDEDNVVIIEQKKQGFLLNQLMH